MQALPQLWRSLYFPGNDVKAASDSHRERSLKLIAVGGDPFVLPGRSHRHEQEMGLFFGYVLHDSLFFVSLKITVSIPDDARPRKPLGQLFRCQPVYLR